MLKHCDRNNISDLALWQLDNTSMHVMSCGMQSCDHHTTSCDLIPSLVANLNCLHKKPVLQTYYRLTVCESINEKQTDELHDELKKKYGDNLKMISQGRPHNN